MVQILDLCHFLAHFVPSLAVKEFLKSINTSRSYRNECDVFCFDPQCSVPIDYTLKFSDMREIVLSVDTSPVSLDDR